MHSQIEVGCELESAKYLIQIDELFNEEESRPKQDSLIVSISISLRQGFSGLSIYDCIYLLSFIIGNNLLCRNQKMIRHLLIPEHRAWPVVTLGHIAQHILASVNHREKEPSLLYREKSLREIILLSKCYILRYNLKEGTASPIFLFALFELA